MIVPRFVFFLVAAGEVPSANKLLFDSTPAALASGALFASLACSGPASLSAFVVAVSSGCGSGA